MNENENEQLPEANPGTDTAGEPLPEATEGVLNTATGTTFLERMQSELEELDGRIHRLGEFINGSPVFGSLDAEERADLTKQHEYMTVYSRVLTRRVDRAVAAEAEVDEAAEAAGEPDEAPDWADEPEAE